MDALALEDIKSLYEFYSEMHSHNPANPAIIERMWFFEKLFFEKIWPSKLAYQPPS
jgi:hypothetical protein